MKIIVILLVVLSSCCEIQALPSGGNCQKRYEDVLEQVVSLREDCEEPVLQDCCAVSIHSFVHRCLGLQCTLIQ